MNEKLVSIWREAWRPPDRRPPWAWAEQHIGSIPYSPIPGRFRSDNSRALHCRLGGEPASIGGESVLLGGEDNVAAISMFTGASAAQPPPPGSGVYGAGCAIGRSL